MPETRTGDYKLRYKEGLFAAYGGLLSGSLQQIIADYDSRVVAHDWEVPLDKTSLISWLTRFQEVLPADFCLRPKILEAAADSNRYEINLPDHMLVAISIHPDVNVPFYAAELVRFTDQQERLIADRLTNEKEYNLTQLQAKLKPGYQQILGVVGDILLRKKPRRDN